MQERQLSTAELMPECVYTQALATPAQYEFAYKGDLVKMEIASKVASFTQGGSEIEISPGAGRHKPFGLPFDVITNDTGISIIPTMEGCVARNLQAAHGVKAVRSNALDALIPMHPREDGAVFFSAAIASVAALTGFAAYISFPQLVGVAPMLPYFVAAISAAGGLFPAALCYYMEQNAINSRLFAGAGGLGHAKDASKVGAGERAAGAPAGVLSEASVHQVGVGNGRAGLGGKY